MVSFGTSYQDAFIKNIRAIETAIGEAFPECEVRRAFTSGMIIKKLKKRDGFHVDTVEEALEGFLADGFTDLIVQPTHIINGIENDNMLKALDACKGRFHSIRVGTPAPLSTVSQRNFPISGKKNSWYSWAMAANITPMRSTLPWITC